MADEFDNPALQGHLDQVLRTIRGVSSDLTRSLADADRIAANTNQAAARQRTSLASEDARGRGGRPRPVVRGTVLEPGSGRPVARQTEDVGRAAERYQRTQERITGNARVQLGILRQQQAILDFRSRQPLQLGPGVTQLGPGRPGTPAFNIGGGGGGGGGGTPPPAPPGGGGGDDPGKNRSEYQKSINSTKQMRTETDALNEAQAESARQGRALQQSQAGNNASLQRGGAQMALYNNSMRRNGALTTEFITAAQRGQVDIRELGFQAGATIAKFAGWTAAATSVFAVVGAMRQLGTGALDAEHGVNLLSRIITTGFDTDGARRELRDLSSDFNLPIDDVAQAAYGMAKVFGDQENTFKATRAALFGVKVGELEAAESTKYLTAIVQGFKLQGDDLMPVMDTINQATNKFGGNVGSMTQGVAAASGAFGAAKGNFRELIAMITTGTRATGRTGQEIGTALRRTSEIIQRPERRSQIIELLGIDPQDSSITEVLEKAMKAVEKASPARRSRILRAITTPELASGRILPLLQNRRLYERVKSETTAEKSQDSAQRELDRALKSPREQLAAIGNQLQRTGAALAQAGLLQPLLLMAKGINAVLQVAEKLVDTFGFMDGAAGKVLFTVGALAATMGALRRLNTGSLFPEGSLGQRTLGRNQNALDRASVLSGISQTRESVQEERRGSAQRYIAADLRERSLTDDLRQAGDLPDEEYARRNEAIVEQQNRKLAALREIDTLNREERQLIDQQKHVKRHGVDAALTRGVAWSPGDVQQNVPRDVVRLPGGGVDVDPAQMSFFDDEAATRSIDADEKLRQENTRKFTRLRQMGVSGRALAGSLDAASTGANSATAAMRRAGSSAAGSVRAFSESSGAAGGLDAVLFGVTAGIAVYQSVSAQLEQFQKDLDAAFAQGKPGRAEAAAKKLEEGNFQDKATSLFARGYNAFQGQLFGGNAPVEAFDPMEARRQAAKEVRTQADVVANVRRKGVALDTGEITRRARVRIAGAKSQAEINKAVELSNRQLNASYLQIYGEDPKKAAAERKKVREFIRSQRIAAQANLRDGGGGRAIDSLAGAEDYAKYIDAAATRMTLSGGSKRSTTILARAAAGARQKAAELARSSPEEAAKALQEADKAEQLILGNAQAKLQRALGASQTPAQSGRARAAYLAEVRKGLVSERENEVARLSESQAKRAKQIEELEAKESLVKGTKFVGEKAAGKVGHRQNVLREQIADLREQIKSSNAKERNIRRDIRVKNEELRALEIEQAKAQFEEELSAGDARSELAGSRTADPLTQARIAANWMRERAARVANAFRRGIASQAELDQATAKSNQTMQALAQAQIADFTSRQSLARSAANINATPLQALRGQLADSQALVAELRSKGNKVSPIELRSALETVNNNKKAINDYLNEQVKAQIQADSAFKQSLTEDPVKDLTYQMQENRKLRGVTKDPNERKKLDAEYNNLKRSRRQQAQQEKYDDLQFEYDIGRIDKTAYLDRLRALYQTIKGNRDLKRNIRRQIAQLEKEQQGDRGEFGLNVGDIRLPTAYDVKRAIGQGRRAGAGSSRSVSVSNQTTVQVAVRNGGDAEAVYDAIDRATGGSVRSAARSAGVI